jgi:hypothetical protein
MEKKLKRIEELDGYIIIRGYEDCPFNPEETKAAVAAAVKKNPALKEMGLEELIEKHRVCFDNVGPGKKLFADSDYGVLEEKFDTLEENQLLTEALQVIPDLRGVEYWQKEASRWTHVKIVKIGEDVPKKGAVLPDKLTAEQREEIAVQERADRIAALSPDEKDAEKQAQIKAVFKEALARKQEAELEAEVNDTPMAFDSVAWARERKTEIEAQYA